MVSLVAWPGIGVYGRLFAHLLLFTATHDIFGEIIQRFRRNPEFMRPFQVLEVKAQCVVGFPSGWPTRSGGEGLKSSGEIA